MSIPVTLVTGFLGAGKTTFINRALRDAAGVKLAAIVNDFGSINIDADLIADTADTVVGLKNGCICCSLQGDLLRTLRQVVKRGDIGHILIEASGVADPRGIIETLMDPVLREAVRLDAVVTIVDVPDITDAPGRLDDPLWTAQVQAADFIGLAKSGASDTLALRARLASYNKALIFDASEPGAFDLLVAQASAHPAPADRPKVTADRFVSLEWEWMGAVGAERFQACIGRLAPQLVRAKGIVNLLDRDGSFSFNLVGRRATMEPLARLHKACRLVLIGERGRLDVEDARDVLLETFADMRILVQNG
ncbi:GTP-binding protein [Devosia sp. ZB163]|uniref:CobW family GTP-binding protein n=1 Tax=Devosia sp. ZB163 TaxID=3025938 RepID=UPI00235E8A5B|nr:GTP-binding protein [Devosia sp. ZB163]MDC9822773.1 GTP-binding protein [Devosia sp. ZB163]